jgi:CheY-like chemotaxis protein
MESRKGSIEVTIANTYLEPSSHTEIKSGAYLMLMVKDTGHGMPPDMMDKIFEPFFTTKEVGKGSGMGLSVVHGILKNHGGVITVESEPERGTKCMVYLPLSGEQDPVCCRPVKDEPSRNGKGKILLIDDEEIILSSLKNALNRIGYEVVTAKDGLDAHELFKKGYSEFDLVITDLTMPHMTGVELADKLMNIRPDIPIILCTGFNDVIDEERAKTIGIKELLFKPASTGELKKAVREALGN